MTLADAMLTARRVEAILNRALADYEASSNADTREFFLLKVQLLIFYYDVLTGMLSVARNNPKGFPQAVVLKPLVNSLYQSEKQMRLTLVPRIRSYTASRKKPIDTAIEAEKEKWRAQLARIELGRILETSLPDTTARRLNVRSSCSKGSIRKRCFPLPLPLSITPAIFYSYFLIGNAVPPNQIK